MFNDEVKAQLKEILAKINKKIIIMYFSEGNSENVNVTKSMLEDLKEINSLINVEYYGLSEDIIKEYDIVENGTLLILNEDDNDFNNNIKLLENFYQQNIIKELNI